MNIKVVHLSTAHARDDVRVFLKECVSLSNAGYDVSLIVADGLGADVANGVKRLDIGKTNGKIQRMLFQPWRMWHLTWRIRADIYHIHEPELLLIALPLMWSGAQVVYDSHEDVPRAILGRDWIIPSLRKFISFTFEIFENFVTARISSVVGATPYISLRFSTKNKQTVTINNFPLKSEISAPMKESRSTKKACYIGNISRIRGIFEIINALNYVDIRLMLAGWFESGFTESEAKKLPSWSKVDYLGAINRAEVHSIMSQSFVGLVIFYPEPNHTNSQPNKLFEYMSSGLPIIASNFPLWLEIIEGNDCGICVDPMNPLAIAEAINFLRHNPERAKQMGENGYKAIQEKYNWTAEEKKLLNLYRQLALVNW